MVSFFFGTVYVVFYIFLLLEEEYSTYWKFSSMFIIKISFCDFGVGFLLFFAHMIILWSLKGLRSLCFYILIMCLFLFEFLSSVFHTIHSTRESSLMQWQIHLMICVTDENRGLIWVSSTFAPYMIYQTKVSHYNYTLIF